MLNKKYFFQQGFILNHDNVSLTFQSYFGNFLMTILMEKSNSYSTEINKKDIEPFLLFSEGAIEIWERGCQYVFTQKVHPVLSMSTRYTIIIVYKNWEILWLLWMKSPRKISVIRSYSFLLSLKKVVEPENIAECQTSPKYIQICITLHSTCVRARKYMWSGYFLVYNKPFDLKRFWMGYLYHILNCA